jgi:hypothetical protein
LSYGRTLTPSIFAGASFEEIQMMLDENVVLRIQTIRSDPGVASLSKQKLPRSGRNF